MSMQTTSRGNLYTAGQGYAGEFDSYPVTTSDSVDLPNGPCHAVLVTGAGNIAVTLPSGATATLTTVPANTVVMIEIQRIKATSTTATGIQALYKPGT